MLKDEAVGVQVACNPCRPKLFPIKRAIVFSFKILNFLSKH